VTTPLLALLAFAGWALLIVLGVVTYRTLQVLMGKKPAHGFKSGVEHGPDLYWRANRAHVNALENLVPFAVVVLVGHAIGHTEPLFSQLAVAVVVLRVLQTSVHIALHTHWSVVARAAFYIGQIGCFIAMGVTLLLA
jgi:uncharacterized MAPEG superfamily protein